MMNQPVKFFTYCLLAFYILSCTRAANPDIERGSEYQFKPGFPEVRFSAVGFLDETTSPQIDIAADIVYGSLIFREVNNQQQAQISIDVQVVSQQNEDNMIESMREDITITRKDENIVSSQQSYIYEEQIEVPPGNYEVNFTVTDQTSGKKIYPYGHYLYS